MSPGHTLAQIVVVIMPGLIQVRNTILHCSLQVSLRAVPTNHQHHLHQSRAPVLLSHATTASTLSPPSRPRPSPSLLSTTTHHTIMLDINYYSAGRDHSVSNRSCSLWSSSCPLPYFRSNLRPHHHCDTGAHPFPDFHPQAQSSVGTLTSACTSFAIFLLPSLAIFLLPSLAIFLLASPVWSRLCVYMHMCMCLSLSVCLFSLLVVKRRKLCVCVKKSQAERFIGISWCDQMSARLVARACTCMFGQ